MSYLPPVNAVTLGEIHGECFHVTPHDDSYMGDEFLRRGGVVFPPARVGQLRKRSPYNTIESFGSESLRHETPAMQFLKGILNGIKQFIIEDELRIFQYIIYHLKRVLKSSFSYLNVYLITDNDDRINPSRHQLSKQKINRENRKGKINAINWHPCLSYLAVAQADDTIALYHLKAAEWDQRAIEYISQREISAIAWSKYAGGTLAVASRGGIFLWKIACGDQSQAPELLEIIKNSNGYGFIDVSWNHDGSMFAAFGENSNALEIYNVTTRQQTQLKCSNNLTSINWSPTGEYLFATTDSEESIVWETCTWKKDVWCVATKCCGWSTNGSCLLVTEVGSTKLFPYVFVGGPPQIDPHIAISPIDFPEKEIYTFDGNAFANVGGEVQEFAWDPSGTRVAVIFKPKISATNSPLVSVFKVSWDPFDIQPRSGLIQGPSHAGLPLHLSFASNFKDGSLLCIAWSSGLLTFHPFYLC